MTVLCVVAHPDDEVLGMGGTLARHAVGGEDVHVCILSDGVTSRYHDVTEAAEEEITRRRQKARAACDRLGVDTLSIHEYPDNQFDTVPLLDIVQTIESEISSHEPDVVYTHHHGDLNIDHELTCRAVVTATRPMADSGIRQVLASETLSASEWSVPDQSNAFQPTSFVAIADQLENKIAGLECYDEELRAPPHPRTIKTVRQNAEVWGAKAGVRAAEPFELLREVRR
jgi:LmbE family N-acetylglucosaminyl deacetylase